MSLEQFTQRMNTLLIEQGYVMRDIEKEILEGDWINSQSKYPLPRFTQGTSRYILLDPLDLHRSQLLDPLDLPVSIVSLFYGTQESEEGTRYFIGLAGDEECAYPLIFFSADSPDEPCRKQMHAIMEDTEFPRAIEYMLLGAEEGQPLAEVLTTVAERYAGRLKKLDTKNMLSFQPVPGYWLKGMAKKFDFTAYNKHQLMKFEMAAKDIQRTMRWCKQRGKEFPEYNRLLVN